ncbi:MAG: nitrous oxide reductase family maturation protein NosD [Candidatus Hodarchaeota archaeon]
MKSNMKFNLIFIGLLFVFSPIFIINISCINYNSNKSLDYRNDFTIDKGNLKLSDVSGKIYIDNNWTEAKSAGICTGSGTYSDPYVIKNLEINGGGSGNCILIKNSDVFCRIEKCSLYNAGTGTGFLGIMLFNVSNAQLEDNFCISNSVGIGLSNSHNNTISGNTVNDNSMEGIFLGDSNNNSIIGNIANSNDFYGIVLSRSHNNTVKQNLIKNKIFGLYIMNFTSHANSIFLNCFINNTNNGYDEGSNYWDNGIKGNYWSDYTGSDSNNDGIGDTPYIIDHYNNKDNFPLMSCPIPTQDGEGFPLELITLISVISGGALIGVEALLLIRRRRKIVE